MGQTDLGAEYIRKAYELRDRVSDRERLFILFLYDRQVTGNLQKELQTLESWAQTYPRDAYALGVMAGWGTRGTGQYERGIQAAQEALRLDPGLSIRVQLSRSTIFCSTGSRRPRMPCGGPRSANWKSRNFWSLVTTSRFSRATRREWNAKSLALAESKARRTGCRTIRPWSWRVPDECERRGRCGSARSHWRNRPAIARRAAIYQAARGRVRSAFRESGCGEKQRARAALELGKGRDVEYAAAFALALSGDSAGSQRLAEDLAERFPEDTPVQFEYLPTLRALFALAHRAPSDAIERLQTALPYDFAMPGTAFFAKFGGLYPAYVRGQAYLAAGRGQEAAAEFQKVLDHRGIVLADPIGALAHLQLGRAYVVLGRQGQSQERLSGLSSPSGRMPTRTSPSSNRPAENTRSYKHHFAP